MKCVHPSILQYMTGFLKDTVIWKYHNCSYGNTQDGPYDPQRMTVPSLHHVLFAAEECEGWVHAASAFILNGVEHTSVYSRVELLYVHLSADLVIYFKIKRRQHFCPPCLVVKKKKNYNNICTVHAKAAHCRAAEPTNHISLKYGEGQKNKKKTLYDKIHVAISNKS